jgi:signal transduction histidine kinase
MSRRFPADAEQDRGVGYVIRTGNAVIQPDVDDPAGLAGALGVEHPRLLRELGARSYIAAPLRGRRGVIGAISLVRSLPGGPRYGAEDLAVAEGLGQRAGLVVENARLYRAARDAVVARDDFLAIAAHELRTPLTTLQLHLQSLSGSHEVTAPIVGKLDRAILQTRRLAKLIDNLLEVSRITAGRLKLQRDAVDLAAITSDVAERLRSMASSAGCTLIVDAREPVTGMWDALRIEQIVTNLVQNAIRYAPGHPIEISVGGNDERARLIVRDHGPGIPADARRRVFERFEKAGIAAQTGLGLGLFITRQIVEAHGGVIRVADEDATGATLIVELPRGGPIPGGSSS